MMKRMVWRAVLAVSLCIVMSQAVHADVYWETVRETKGMPQGMPPNMPKEMMKQFDKTETVRNFMTDKAFRMEAGDVVTITNFDTMIVYHLNSADKTCTKMDLKAMSGDEKMAEMMKNMQAGIKITPSNETQKIAGYDCKKYLMTGMMGGDGEYWVSKDVKGYKQLKEMSLKMKSIMEKTPMFRDMGMTEQMDGFPVRMTMKMMGMTTTNTLKQIEEKTLDKKLFEVPEGYTMNDMPMMGGAMDPSHAPMKKSETK